VQNAKLSGLCRRTGTLLPVAGTIHIKTLGVFAVYNTKLLYAGTTTSHLNSFTTKLQ